jgi:hypothetical protein
MKRGFKLIVTYCLFFAACFTTHAQGTAFTYQGRLNDSGSPATGNYDLTFSLFYTNATGVAVAGPVTNSATVVSNGLFTTAILPAIPFNFFPSPFPSFIKYANSL